ncbi:hypothetical protein GCM10008983_01530 [Lentibacillus halophilus]|uniref:Uncharacterized protein n=1 Tax=Lentibacillus halophilus TaxID=295065 RepID=A0ABN0Z1S6_9BACI
MGLHLTPEQTNAIRQKWIEQGRPKCNHSCIGKEYMYGAHSDYVCLSCGTMHTERSAFKTMK